MRVTFTRLVAIGPGIVVAVLTQDNQTLSDKFQEWINILQSIQLTFALLPVLHFTSDPQVRPRRRRRGGGAGMRMRMRMRMMMMMSLI
jgi:Mn2+/Fe2+ NRAMP family transporter